MVNLYGTENATNNYMEKRKYKRHFQSIAITYVPIYNNTKYPTQGHIVNYSEGGILFEAKDKIDPGTNMSIHITIRNKHFIIKGNTLRSNQSNLYQKWHNAIACAEQSDHYVMKTIENILQPESSN
ncbi:MAG: PilZ domain-containing protein [Chlamydiota bacterium]|nr:PilZ domain-containing protein [Chlamydiota bacterium]